MAITDAEKRAALEAVLESETLGRSEQLRSFLKFVCEMEMDGRAGELTEALIGIRALGRPEDYSPLEDSSVRTRAHELRQRLQRYYATENPHYPIRIDLPKGSYAPRFTQRPATVEGAPETDQPTGFDVSPAGSEEARRRRRIWVGGFVTGVGVAGLVIVAWVFWPGGASAGLPLSPALRQAWEPLVATDPEVVICLATPLHLLVSPSNDAPTDQLPRYPAPAETYALYSRFRPLPWDRKLELQPVQKAVPMGTLQGLLRVASILQSLGARHRVLPETSSPLAAIKGRSAVVFGSPWYSRAVTALLEKTPWTLGEDDATKEVGLLERDGKDQRMLLPRRGPRGEYQEVWGLVTVLPSDRSGGKTVVVFSGLTSVGAHGAAAFFTSAASMSGLKVRLRNEGYSQWPRSYQVVVHCRASEDTQLLSYDYESHRVIAK